MADQESQSYYIKLIKGFNVPHRRAGILFQPGPTPVEVQLDEDQLALIQGDAAFQILTEEEFTQYTEAHGTIETIEAPKASEAGSTEEEDKGDKAPVLPEDDPEAKLAPLKERAAELGIEGAENFRSKAEAKEAIKAHLAGSTEEEE